MLCAEKDTIHENAHEDLLFRMAGNLLRAGPIGLRNRRSQVRILSGAYLARKARVYVTVAQPNHVETVVAEVNLDGEKHLVKLSRYHDNQQFWTVPGESDERLHGRATRTVFQPEADEYELYDLTLDPLEEHNLAHPANADDRSRALQRTVLGLLTEQLLAKRLTPADGEVPGYRPPAPA